ncbi:MAG: T9SS type A sorting domain-containing protein [Bacteroidetes bacterium]|nr:T9SS type A sorting domain-containing protein [Bacteroidota bacterium]
MKKLFLLSLTTLLCIITIISNAQVSVTATAGTLGPTAYTTLKLAFDAINAGTHQGVITVSISASTTEGTTPANLNSSGAGSASYTSVLIRPTNDGVSISGNPVTGFGVIQLNGADNVTIDGDNPNTSGINRNLTIANTAANTVAYNSVIRLATTSSAVVTNCDNVTIMNCLITGNASGRLSSTSTTGSENTTFGVLVAGKGGATATGAPTAITSVSNAANAMATGTTVNTFLVNNCWVNSCARGIAFLGFDANSSIGVTFQNNTIGAAGPPSPTTPPYTSPSTTVYTKGIIIQGTKSLTITGNTVQYILTNVGTATNGIELTSAIGAAGGSINVSNNTITGVQNYAGSAANAIIFSSAAIPYSLASNLITDIQTTSTSSAAGINVGTSAASGTIEKNKISTVYARSTSGYTARGIYLNGGSNLTVQNNMIWDLNVVANNSNTSTTFGVWGIQVASGTGHKIYHNSVSLSGAILAGGSSPDPTACLGINTTSLTGIDVRNNLFSNTMTGGSNSANSCLQLPTGGTSAMNLTLNNNAYFSTSGTYNYILITSSTFASYTAANFNASLTTPATNSRFYTSTLSAAGTNDNASMASVSAAPFATATNLHIPSATSTQLESAGATVGLLSDIDGDVRPGPAGSVNGGATAPDLGADEFDGIPVDLTPPTINYTPLTNTSSTTSRTLVATITDASGVGSGVNQPVLYWKIDAGAYSSPLAPTSIIGSQYTYTFGAGVVAGNVISYFIVAQDNASTPNVTSFPSGATCTYNPPLAFAGPPSPSQYTILGMICGNKHVGVGKDYTTLTDAINAINISELSCALKLYLDDATYPSETFPIILNANPGSSAVNTITIQPNPGVSVTISGSSATGLVKTYGADYVIIDGLNTGGSSLTFNNSNAAGVDIWISSTPTDGATFNTVKNCTLTGNSGSTTVSGILAGSGTVYGNPAEVANSNNAIQLNICKSTQNGAFISGCASNDQNWNISNNTFGSTVAAEKHGFRGIFIGNASNFQISNNSIVGVQSSASSSSTTCGIQVGGTISGGTISGNVIGNISQINTTGWGAAGIYLGASSTASNLNIFNNLIYDVTGYGYSGVTSTDNGYGIMIDAGGGYNLFYNSVNMYTSETAAGSIVAAINISSSIVTANSLTIKNNIFNIPSTNTVGTRYAIYSGAANTVFSDINNNDYSSVGTLGYLGSARATIAAWQTATGKDALSLNIDPQFTGSTNLHTVKPELNNAGSAIGGITTDYAAVTRSNPPDIGAYEFTLPITSINTLAATSLGQTTATVNGNINTANESVAMSFEYGLDLSYGSNNAGTPSPVRSLISTAVSSGLTGLAPNSLYHYRIKGISATSAETKTGVDMTFYTLPSPIISGPATACAGSTGNVYTTEASMSNYAWIISAGGSITSGGGTSDNTVTVTWNTATPQTVSVNYQNAGGQSAPSPTVYNVTVNSLPVPTIVELGGHTADCDSSFGYTYTTEPGMTNYLWSVSAGGSVTSGGGTGDNTVTLDWWTPGAQTVSVNYTNAGNCTASSPTVYNVTVHARPVPSLTGNGNPCVNGPGEVYTTDAGMPNYIWFISGGGTITAGGGLGDNTVTINWTSSGSNSVGVTYQNSYGCWAFTPTNLPVTVNDLPVPSLSGNGFPCIGSTGVVYSTDAGMSNYTWSVSGGGAITAGGGPGDNSVTITWNSSGNQTVEVNYQNGSGCWASTPTSEPVTVIPLPIPTITGPASLCGVPSTGNVYSTEWEQNGYTWSVSAGGSITSGSGTQDITVTWATAGAKTVTVSYTNADGCTAASPASYPVDVFDLPAPTIEGSATICGGPSPGNHYITEAGMSNYAWTVSAGGTITDGSATNDITVTWATTGAKTITVTYTDGNGCIPAVPSSKTVNVYPLPVPTITVPAITPCNASSGNIYSTEGGMTGYTWNISSGGTITAGDGTGAITVTWNDAGAQWVSVTYTDGNGCSPVTPTVSNFTILGPTLTGSAIACENDIKSYTTEVGHAPYTWTHPGSILMSGGTIADNFITVMFLLSGNQQIGVAYAGTCTQQTIKNVTVSPSVPTLTGSTSVCVNSDNAYTTDAGNSNYSWTVISGTVTSGGGTGDSFVNVHWTTAGSGSIQVSYTSAAGCTVTPVLRTITVNPLPVPTLTGPLSPPNGSTGNVYTTESGMFFYSWIVSAGGTITAGGGSVSNTVTVTWNYAGPQTVSVSYIDGNSCSPASPTVLNVNVSGLPGPAGPITGVTPVCQGQSGVAYLVAPIVGATGYVWSLPSGATIAAGGNTNSITVDFSPTAVSGDITVYGTNGGGDGTVSPPYAVTVLPTPIEDPVPNQFACNGATTAPVTFTASIPGTVFDWTNNNTAIGLAASGTGNLPSFNATNPGTLPVAATITVTPTAPDTVTQSFTYTGSMQTWTVPAGVTSITIEAYGAEGGTGATGVNSSSGGVGGKGSKASGTLSVTPGQVLNLFVGGAGATPTAGYNGGAAGGSDNSGGGGGASDIRYPGVTAADRILVAGGGGGGGRAGCNPAYVSGGAGGDGDVNGVKGTDSPNGGGGFGGVGQTGGLKGIGCAGFSGNNGFNAILNVGGAGGAGQSCCCPSVPGGGGGGGGYFGGGGGGGGSAGTVGCGGNDKGGGGGGAGGTSYLGGVSGGALSTGIQTGNGLVKITYSAGASCTGTPVSFTYTVNPSPVPTVSGPSPACNASTGNVYTTQAGMTGYTWTVTGGTITAGAGTSAITVTWNTPGIQTVSVIYTDGNGCTATTPGSKSVIVLTLPTPTISGPVSICAGSTGNVYTTEAGNSSYIWTVSAGGSITAGNGTNAITVTWNTAGAQTVTVTYTDIFGCTATAPTVFNVTVNPRPVPVITGPASVCINSTGNVYTTGGGNTNYIWVVSAGGSITAGGGAANNTVTITWNTIGAQSVTVSYTNAFGCTTVTPTVYPVTVNALPVPTITGPTPVCAASTGNVYTTQAGMSGYLWSVSAGGSITAGSGTSAITVTWNTAGAQTVSVNYTNANGCTAAAPTVFNVTVNALPVPTITGPSPVCATSTGNVYTTEAGMSGYLWAVSAGGSITAGSGTNAITVTWNTAGAQTVSVNYTNAAGCTALAPTVKNVTVNALPVPTIAGPTPVCAASTGNVYTTQAGMTNYLWSVSAGGSITAGGGTGNNTVTITWNTAGAQTVSVNYTNANGCTAAAPTVYNVTVNALPVPTITGPASVCAGSTGNVYTTQGGQTNYLWVVSAGGSITAGGGTGNNTVTVTWNTAGARTVSVNYTNAAGCTALTPTVYNVTVNALPVPTITGPASVCVTSTGNVYTTEAGMTNYLWNVSAGGSITAGGGTGNNTVTVTWNTVGAQTVSVNYTNANGCTAVAPTVYNVTVNALPVPTIAGPTPVCVLSTGNIYTTQAGNSGYLWNVTGGTITAGAGTSAITVTWNIAGAQTVSVNYTNPAGCTAAAPTVFNVTVTPTVGTPTPITVAGGVEPTCQLTNGTTTTTYATTATNSTGFNWSLSNGAAGVIGATTGIMTWANGFAGSVNIQVTANGCNGPSAMVIRTVVVTPTVGVPVFTLGATSTRCQGAGTVTYTATATNNTGITYILDAASLAAGITINGATGAVTYTAGWVGVSMITATATGCNGPSTAFHLATTNPRPGPTLSGPTPVCVNAAGNVYTTEAGMSAYTWVVSAGGSITAGGGPANNTVTVTWLTAGAKTVSVNYTNGFGCPALAPTVFNVTVNPLPVPTIAGPTPICVGTTGNVYSTQTGMSGYLWSVSAGGSITSGSGTSAITVTWLTAGAQTVSVTYTNANGCAAAAPTVYNVTVNAVPVPTISGQTNMCVNSGYYNYTTETGMTGYLWTVSSGGIINYGSGTYQIQVSWIAGGAQTVSVTYSNGVGCSAAQPTVLNVTVNPLPDQAGAITGTATVCAGQNGVAYSVAPIPSTTTYIWTLPTGATIASGAGTNSITVDFGANAASGNITVYGNNICGNGGTSPAFAVTINPLPDTPAAITGPAQVCEGETGVVYSVPTIANATGYNWTLPAGATITAGANTSSITVSFAMGAASGVITVNGTNTCGNGPLSPDFNLTVNVIPDAPVVTNTGTTLISSAPTGNQWYFSVTQAGTGAPIAGATAQTYVATQDGWYWSVVTLNGCSSDESNRVHILTTGIDKHASASINLYPVPNDGRFTASIVTPSTESFSISVYNNLGVKIYQEDKVEVNGKLQKLIDLRPAPNGVYTVIFENGQNLVIGKIVINK